MIRRLIGAGLCAFAVVLVAMAFAAPDRKAAQTPPRPKCPAGGNYYLSTKPSKEHPVAVRIQGRTYYVCRHCKDLAGKSPTAKTKPASAQRAARTCAGCPSKAAATCATAAAAKCPKAPATKPAPKPATR